MFRLIAFCLAFFVFCAQTLCQNVKQAKSTEKNPYQWLGQAHNAALDHLKNKGFWQTRPNDSLSMVLTAQDYFIQQFPQLAAKAPTHRIADLYFATPQTFENDREAVYRALQLKPEQIAYLEKLFLEPETGDDLTPVLATIDGLERSLTDDLNLTEDEKRLPYGCLAIARSSAEYWSKFDGFDVGGDSTKADTVRIRKKVPFKRWFKADLFGLMKGFIGGALLYGGSVYLKSPEATGIVVGVWVLINIPVMESLNYARKYRRGEVEEKNPENKEWEIDPNKL